MSFAEIFMNFVCLVKFVKIYFFFFWEMLPQKQPEVLQVLRSKKAVHLHRRAVGACKR